jgi:hypothetical protein
MVMEEENGLHDVDGGGALLDVDVPVPGASTPSSFLSFLWIDQMEWPGKISVQLPAAKGGQRLDGEGG